MEKIGGDSIGNFGSGAGSSYRIGDWIDEKEQ